MMTAASFFAPMGIGIVTGNLWLWGGFYLMSFTASISFSSCYRRLRAWAIEPLGVEDIKVGNMTIKMIVAEGMPFAAIAAGAENAWLIAAARFGGFIIQLHDHGSMNMESERAEKHGTPSNKNSKSYN